MSRLLPKELVRAKELMDQAKLEEALEIIENYEKIESLSSRDQLSALLIKATIYRYNRQYRKSLEISELAYQISQELGLMFESAEALIRKMVVTWLGDLDKASAYASDAERRLNSLDDDYSTRILRRTLVYSKSWIQFFRIDFNGAEELALESLKQLKEEKSGNKLDLAATYLLLGWINLYRRNLTEALDYAMKSLKHDKVLSYNVAIADDYSLIARIYRFEGNYDQALEYCKLSLSIKEISKRCKLNVLETFSDIYYLKSELNKSLSYRQQAVSLAEELQMNDLLIMDLLSMGYLYRTMGKYDQAVDYFERGLTLSEKWGFTFFMSTALFLLVYTYLDQNLRERANRYFSRISDLYDKTKERADINIYPNYLLSKAYMMKTSTRMRDRVKAQALYKELIAMKFISGDALILSMGNLCDLLLEELSLHNDPEILDEIAPLITKSLDMAEKANNYYWLAETKLLQAKLALIQMNTEEAKKLMVEAQRIADFRGLDLLAWGISSEHDKLLEQLDVWNKVKEEQTPMAERVKLASTNGVLGRIQGKGTIEPPESVDEQSTVLLILAEGGILVFSYPFSDEWRIDEDLFSSFLSAFKSFSTEFFSKGLDRVKFGDDMMLMESIGNFSFCYLFKGQTYLARQKLTKFTEELQQNSSLWQDMEQHYKTSQVLELRENPQLESLITEIFISKS
ncbi:MAG: hypothetical protein ACFE94_04025 [Candidatus Hodarchaeota archaeon]